MLAKVAVYGACLALLLAGSVYFFASPAVVDKLLNGRTWAEHYPTTEAGQGLHASLEVVADLHCDALLWPGRSLVSREVEERRGHVDLERMQQGNVGLQAFFAPTKVPWTINIHKNSNDTWDILTLLYHIGGQEEQRPRSLLERALLISDLLHSSAEQSMTLPDGAKELTVVKTATDLEDFVGRRRSLRQRGEERLPLAGVLGIEGLHCAEGRLDSIEVLYDAGFRILGISHFFDNELGGSAHGELKGGLTEFGRAFVEEMAKKQMIVDLAHASPAVIDDVLATASRPPLFSHTGVQGTCPTPRNINDDHVKRTAELGGLIGIGFWEDATCGDGAKDVVAAIRYVADLVGVAHVALGSDWDGAVKVSFGADEVSQVTEGLILEKTETGEPRFTADEISAIMGDNVVRFLLRWLPRIA